MDIKRIHDNMLISLNAAVQEVISISFRGVKVQIPSPRMLYVLFVIDTVSLPGEKPFE